MGGSCDKNDNNKRPRDDDDGFPSLLKLLDLHVDLRVNIFNYLGQTQEELMNLTLVSKKVNTDCKLPCIEWKIIPTIEISPTKGGGSIRALLQLLRHHLLDNDTNNKLRRYRHMKVNDIHEFNVDIPGKEIYEIIKDIRMDWILSLDMSLSTSMTINMYCLPDALSNILPKLYEIDLSNLYTDDDENGIVVFSYRCPHLEKITWFYNGNVELNGRDMVDSKNLKEIIMDDTDFFGERGEEYWDGHEEQEEMEILSNLENQRDKFIFYNCSKVLERVSIRNAKWYPYGKGCTDINEVVPQNALIKFVRNAPTSLRWFRSDLTQDNMTMLRLERPEIELLN
jgi:hypothetical protein